MQTGLDMMVFSSLVMLAYAMGYGAFSGDGGLALYRAFRSTVPRI
jgi:hypothetical protein